MPSHATTPRVCEQCGAVFAACVKRVTAGGGKYCRIECFRLASRIPPETAFWLHVQKTEECWLWIGARNEHGYGTLTIRTGRHQRSVKAHRYAWELANGPIPPGAWVLHDCDTKACVRPSHLHLGDRGKNIAEAIERSRIASGDRHWSKRLPESRARGERNGHAKMSAENVREARRRYANGGITQAALARDYGVDRTTMRDALRGKNWQHL